MPHHVLVRELLIDIDKCCEWLLDIARKEININDPFAHIYNEIIDFSVGFLSGIICFYA